MRGALRPQSAQTGFPSVSGQRRRRNTFSTPPSDMRMILAALSERAPVESRKCCAMRTDRERKTGITHGSVSPQVQGRFHRWQQLHNPAHFAVRGLMHKAALRADEDPDRLSFLHAVRVMRRKLPLLAAFPPSAQARPA